MTRDIFILTRKPDLRKKWTDTIVEYIREHYGNPPGGVDAIVDPNTRGYVFGVTIATKLRLPYIPIQEAGEIQADPDDVIRAIYTNRKNEVIVLILIILLL